MSTWSEIKKKYNSLYDTDHGKLSGRAIGSIQNNNVEAYVPLDEEKEAWNKFKLEYAKNVREAKAKELWEYTRDPLFVKYGIDPLTFDQAAFDKWAQERGLGYFADVTDDKKKLKQLAIQNEYRKKKPGALETAAATFVDRSSMGITTKLTDLSDANTGAYDIAPPGKAVTYSQYLAQAQEEHPVASFVGNVAGGLVPLGVAIKGVGTAVKVLPGLRKAPEWVQHLVTNVLAFGGTGAAETAVQGGTAGEIAKQAGISALGGFGGTVASGVVGKIGEKILFNKSLQHKIIPEIVRASASSSSFMAGMHAPTYLLYPEEYRPTGKELAVDLAVGFALGAIFSTKAIIKTSSANKKYIDNLVSQQSDLYKALAYERSRTDGKSELIKKYASRIIDSTKELDEKLASMRLVGQHDAVMKIHKANASLRDEMIMELSLANAEPAPEPSKTKKLAPPGKSEASKPIESETDELMATDVSDIKAGDVLSSEANGNKITVIETNGEKAKIEVDNGVTVSERSVPVAKIKNDIASGRVEKAEPPATVEAPKEPARGNADVIESAAQGGTITPAEPEPAEPPAVETAPAETPKSGTNQGKKAEKFKKGTFQIKNMDGSIVDTPGLIYKGVAVHKNKSGKYALTHIESGRRFDEADTLADARAKARYYGDKLDMSRSAEDKDFLASLGAMVHELKKNPALYKTAEKVKTVSPETAKERYISRMEKNSNRQNAERMYDKLQTAVESKDFEALTEIMHRANKISLAFLRDITDMPVDNIEKIKAAIRSLDPAEYDAWEAGKSKAAEDSKLEAQREKSAQKQAEAEKISADYSGFLDGVPAMQAGRIKNALAQVFNTEAFGRRTYKSFIEEAVKNGWKVRDGNGKRYLIMSPESGFAKGYEINKTAADYALYLSAKSAPSKGATGVETKAASKDITAAENASSEDVVTSEGHSAESAEKIQAKAGETAEGRTETEAGAQKEGTGEQVKQSSETGDGFPMPAETATEKTPPVKKSGAKQDKFEKGTFQIRKPILVGNRKKATMVDVTGEVYKGVGVYKEENGGYALAHIESGMKFDLADTLSDAKAKARYYGDKLDMSRSAEDKDFVSAIANIRNKLKNDSALYRTAEKQGNETKYSLERSGDNEKGLHSNGNGGRQTGKNTAGEAEGVAGRAKGDSGGERHIPNQRVRKLQAQNAKDNGQVKRRVVGGVGVEVIERGGYAPEMQEVYDFAAERFDGEVVLFAGPARLPNGEAARGFIVGNGTLAVRYDSRVSPYKTVLHEIAHARSGSASFGKALNVIKNSLTVIETQKIQREYYERYYKTTGGNEALIFEEFVCDVLAGLSNYSGQFGELSKRFWSGREIDPKAFTPAEYAESIDAGGFVDMVGFGEVTDVRYLLGRTAQGQPIVIVERDILKGVPKKQWVKTAVANLEKKFPMGVIINQQQISIDAQSRREITRSGYSQYVQRYQKPLFADKLRATDNADEILIATVNWINEAPKHIRKDEIIDFAKGKVNLRVLGNDYTADALVAITKNGKAKLYDILDITPTTHTIKVPPVADSTSKDEFREAQEEPIDDSITQNGGNVNSANEKITQEISSAKTSRKQVAALFKNPNVEYGAVNIDIGGGKFDLATEFLESKGVENLIFDPFNRSGEVNQKAVDYIRDKGGADTVTVANVLNVIKEAEARGNVILEAAKAIKPGGKAYFSVYKGDGSGIGAKTTAGHQNNQKLSFYLPEIEQFFNDVQLKGELIIARSPKSDLPAAQWDITPVEYVRFSIDSEIDSLTPERVAEINKRYDKHKAALPKLSFKEKWGERAAWAAHNISRVFPDIPERGERGIFFAEFRKAMVQWRALPKTASFMVQDMLGKMTEGLSPKEFETFEKLVYFRNLREDAKIQQARGDEIKLPDEITPHEVDGMVTLLEGEATEAVKAALELRQNIWNELKEQYVPLNRAVGFDVDGRFIREDYFHHQLIKFMGKIKDGVKKRREMGVNTERSWLKEREGTTDAVNTDFLAVEYKTLLEMKHDTYKANSLVNITEQYDIKPRLEKEAFLHNKEMIDAKIAKESDGRVDLKGNPDSETYRQQNDFNRRIMLGYNGLMEAARENRLPELDGGYSDVIAALKKGDLNAVEQAKLYNYVQKLAGGAEGEQTTISARTVLKYTAQKKAWVKDLLGEDFQTWQSLVDDAHGIFQPRKGNYFYTKETVDERAFQKALEELIEMTAAGQGFNMEADVAALFKQHSKTLRSIGASYKQFVLPKEIIKTMDAVANPTEANRVAKAVIRVTSLLKGWFTYYNPLRTVKHGVRNLTGDVDAVIAGKPQIVVYAKQAMNEIYDAMKHKKYTPDFLEWVERGGYSSILYANDMEGATRDKLFSHLSEKSGKGIFDIPKKLLEGYVGGVEAAHNFREAILRYSAYLYFKSAVAKNGVTDYVASNRFIVQGLKSLEDKAFQLSKDLLGAYDEVGRMGQILRQLSIPFYSFTELNARRYYRLFENVLVSDAAIPTKARKLMLKALMANLMGLLMIGWNLFVMKDADDKLPPSVRSRPHLTLGKVGDNVYAFTRVGAFSELLEWVGLDDYKLTGEDITAPLDKAAGMVTPLIKLPLELTTGLTLYPEVTKPRAIRDNWTYFFDSMGVGQVYSAATGKPTRGVKNIAKGAFLYTYAYEESAYYEILDRKREFQKTDSGNIYRPNEKSNALYYMKLAIRYGDKKAALKYMKQYFAAGGTGKGIVQAFRQLDPLYGFTSAQTLEKGQQFIKFLNDNEKEKLVTAYRYYDEVLRLPEDVEALLKKKDLTEAEARKVLTKYIMGVK
jgi:SAM-dependent methyltransferase